MCCACYVPSVPSLRFHRRVFLPKRAFCIHHQPQTAFCAHHLTCASPSPPEDIEHQSTGTLLVLTTARQNQTLVLLPTLTTKIHLQCLSTRFSPSSLPCSSSTSSQRFSASAQVYSPEEETQNVEQAQYHITQTPAETSLWTIPASLRTRLDKTRIPHLQHCLSAKMSFRIIVGILCLALTLPVFVDLVSLFN